LVNPSSATISTTEANNSGTTTVTPSTTAVQGSSGTTADSIQASTSQANIQHSAVTASAAIEPTAFKSQNSGPLAVAQANAAEISKDLSTQPSSVFNGDPILLEAVHEHSINAQALDGAIKADISHETRVLDRSTLLMSNQNDVLRVEATTDINISLFESMGVELHGEISSVAMEFSKIDMGGGDDIVEINSVLSLDIDSSEDIAKLIGDIDQEELGMLDSILMGGDGNDTMIVNGAVRSRIDGGTGNDDLYLTGESQYVTLDGGAGDDRIFGTSNNETLIGGDGDDLLFGHGGLDEMTGGRGSDIFIVDMDEGVDLGNLNALSDFEKTVLSGKISNAELASITDFNGMEGDAIALRSASIGVTQRAEDLFVYTPSASDMDKQVLLLSTFDEFFFSGKVEVKEGYALLTDLDTLVQVTDDGHLHALAHVSSQVTPSNGMVFTTNNSLSS
jgi:Ca2+-binding RTX toxin-like protein